MEKIFVTGADGMLGSSICRELLNQGYVVKAMCFPGRVPATLNGLSIEIVYGNVLDKSFLLKEMQGCNKVINVAALTNVYPRRSKIVNDVNYSGAKNVMEVVEELKMTRMVHIGSASSFDHGSKQNPGDERSGYNGWKYGMDYIDSKFKAQQLLLEKHAKDGFPVIIVNPTFMIGPFDSGPSSGAMLINLATNNIPGYTGGGKNFVCSVDVANAAVNALKLGRLGQCYIAGGKNLDFKEFFEKACEILGKPFKLKKIPQFLVLIVGFFNSIIARLTKSKPKLSFGMAKMASISQCFSPAKAIEELQMTQTPIEVGIKQCLDWFKANNYLK
jgi:dihydroflavonol-4-reductase